MSGATIYDFPSGFARPRVCEGDGCSVEMDSADLGALCARCRERATALPLSYAQSTVASAIRELERYEKQGAPLALPLQLALMRMRRAHDAIEPRIQAPQLGRVLCLQDEWWAYPESTSEALGPFMCEGDAGDALLDHASKYGKASNARE